MSNRWRLDFFRPRQLLLLPLPWYQPLRRCEDLAHNLRVYRLYLQEPACDLCKKYYLCFCLSLKILSLSLSLKM